MPRLFVYGTLMAGFPNHHVLGKRAVLVGRGRLGGFALRDLHGFPGMVPGECRDEVSGEVWDVPAEWLPFVDRLEGAPDFYRRVHETIDMEDGSMTRAQTYVLANPERYADRDFVLGGCWRRHYAAVRSGGWSERQAD
jgi:gamma-glutamylcyclotransferase (GGCT)/AIG2-like uncharacterized protein YtfP